MTILGVETLIYGVKDLANCLRFFEDFGLPATARSPESTDFTLADGSHVVLRRDDDPMLPAPFAEDASVREVIWGVSAPIDLDSIEKNLQRDRSVVRDATNTLHCRDDVGIAIGFRVFDRKSVDVEPEMENSLGRSGRINRHRRWYKRAQPKTMHHVVFTTPDIVTASRFYLDRLGFRLCDVSKGLGVFLRCDGRHDHHNLFFLNSAFVRSTVLGWHHVSFGVDNIDELMTGADYMQRRGWTSDLGIGRHRIASTLFYYLKNPAGGEAEYSADVDYLTDDWKPRLWEPNFGAFSWIGKLPPFALDQPEPEWIVRVIDEENPDIARLVNGDPADYKDFATAAAGAAATSTT